MGGCLLFVGIVLFFLLSRVSSGTEQAVYLACEWMLVGFSVLNLRMRERR